jgi:hypothetical protein
MPGPKMLNVIALSIAAEGFAIIAAYNVAVRTWRGIWDETPRTYWFHLAFLYSLSAFCLGLAFRSMVVSP